MSFDLSLVRLRKGRRRAAKDRQVLEEMATAAQAAVPPHEADMYSIVREEKVLRVEFEDGFGTVFPSDAHFVLYELRPDDVAVIFAIARAGDMTVLVDAGPYPAILTDPAQRATLPANFVGADIETPVATNPMELRERLSGAFEQFEAYRSKIATLYGADEAEPTTDPWRSPFEGDELVYLQAAPGERYMKQLAKLFRFKPPQGEVPVVGTMWVTVGRLRFHRGSCFTPTGQPRITQAGSE